MLAVAKRKVETTLESLIAAIQDAASSDREVMRVLATMLGEGRISLVPVEAYTPPTLRAARAARVHSR